MDSLGVSRLGSTKASLANSRISKCGLELRWSSSKKKKNSEKLLVARSVKWLGTACGLEVFLNLEHRSKNLCALPIPEP